MDTKDKAVGNPRVRRVTNKNINQGQVGETDDPQEDLSFWNTSGARLVFHIWSTSATGATAIAATAIEEAGLIDRAGHCHTQKSSAQGSAARKLAKKLRPAPKDGDADLHLVLRLASGEPLFVRLTSCGSTSETVKKALCNTDVLDPFSSDAPGPKAFLITFDNCLLEVRRTGQS